jgi:hypothetical protein
MSNAMDDAGDVLWNGSAEKGNAKNECEDADSDTDW